MEQWEVSRDVLGEVTVYSRENPSIRYSFQSGIVQGIAYPPWMSDSRWSALNDRVKYRSSDILIVSYPKCGTTWSEQCVLALLANGKSDFLDPRWKNSFHPVNNPRGKIWIESMVDQNPAVQNRMGAEAYPISWEELDAAPSPRVLKSHAPPSLLLGGGPASLPEGMKVLVVCRNPLDACVSSYYHAFNPHRSGWPFPAWATAWIGGYSPHGSYLDWVTSWQEEVKRHPGKCIWVQFEQMKKDPISEIERIASFLGISTNSTTATDKELAIKVAELSSFESMKSQAEQSGGDTIGHLRKGETGDWKQHFSPELKEEFIARLSASSIAVQQQLNYI